MHFSSSQFKHKMQLTVAPQVPKIQSIWRFILSPEELQLCSLNTPKGPCSHDLSPNTWQVSINISFFLIDYMILPFSCPEGRL